MAFRGRHLGNWVVVFSALVSGPVRAEEPALNAGQHAVATPLQGSAEVILLNIDKANLKAELRTWPEDATKSQVIESFRIAIGKEEGDKQREGDNKTPEGIYFTQTHIAGEKLPQKYGPKAIPLDFPNPLDHKEGKTGSGIWLHGVEEDGRIQGAKVTEGCVAFYNSDIEKLTNWLKPHQGLVVITPDGSQVNRIEDVQAVMARAKGWAQSWSERQLDQYVGFYDERFVNAGRDRAAWKVYKKQVFSSYKTMVVKLDNFRALSHPKYALSIMNQDFRGDKRFVSDGRKLLYWRKAVDGQWYIVHEAFEPRRLEAVRFPVLGQVALPQQASSVSADAGGGKGSSL